MTTKPTLRERIEAALSGLGDGADVHVRCVLDAIRVHVEGCKAQYFYCNESKAEEALRAERRMVWDEAAEIAKAFHEDPASPYDVRWQIAAALREKTKEE